MFVNIFKFLSSIVQIIDYIFEKKKEMQSKTRSSERIMDGTYDAPHTEG